MFTHLLTFVLSAHSVRVQDGNCLAQEESRASRGAYEFIAAETVIRHLRHRRFPCFGLSGGLQASATAPLLAAISRGNALRQDGTRIASGVPRISPSLQRKSETGKSETGKK